MNLDGKVINLLNKKHSTLVQERLFSLGYKWGDGQSTIWHSGIAQYPIKIIIKKEYDSVFWISEEEPTMKLKDLKEIT